MYTVVSTILLAVAAGGRVSLSSRALHDLTSGGLFDPPAHLLAALTTPANATSTHSDKSMRPFMRSAERPPSLTLDYRRHSYSSWRRLLEWDPMQGLSNLTGRVGDSRVPNVVKVIQSQPRWFVPAARLPAISTRVPLCVH